MDDETRKILLRIAIALETLVKGITALGEKEIKAQQRIGRAMLDNALDKER